MSKDRIVAVGLLTEQDLNLLGESFTRVWPMDDTPCFSELLEAIDEATGKSDAEGNASASSSRIE